MKNEDCIRGRTLVLKLMTLTENKKLHKLILQEQSAEVAAKINNGSSLEA